MRIFRRIFAKTRKYDLPADHDLKCFKSNGTRYRVDLKPYLREFLKDGFQEVDFDRYEIFLTTGTGSFCLKKNPFYVDGVYRDCEFTFVLFKKHRSFTEKAIQTFSGTNSEAIACLGFDHDKKDEKAIVVGQIQGVPKRKEQLHRFRWEKMLLKIAVDWARANGFLKVKVVRAENNHWYNGGRHQNLYMKYDVTAKRSGFKFDPAENLYVLPLAQ